MAINISAQRAKQVAEVVDVFTNSFRPLDDNFTEADFLSVYDENIAWYDHGFHVCRVGHASVLGLQKAFLHCNQPFKAENKSVQITATGAAFQQVWRGRCVNDIVRPDGQVAKKANGKDFVSHVGFFLEISDAGKITRIDEYDYRNWDDGKPEGEYIRMGAVSHQLE